MSAEDWTQAALDALLLDGPQAVAVQPLARRLGTSKGSFYWFFDNRDDLLRAAVERWHETETEAVIREVDDATEDDVERIRLLFSRFVASTAAHPGQMQLFAAVDQPLVAEAVLTSMQRRIDYLVSLVRRAGFSRAVAARRARWAYATYLGHAQLAHATPDVLPRSATARRELLEEMTRTLLSGR